MVRSFSDRALDDAVNRLANFGEQDITLLIREFRDPNGNPAP